MAMPLATRAVPLFSKAVRRNTGQNALRIFGFVSPARQQRRYTRDVVDSFYQFVLDVGRSSRESADMLAARIERVEGEPAYRQLRDAGRGVVLVTAHMGSFEVGLAALRRVEPRVHVVFKQDASSAFEAMRSKMRRTIGIVEAPIDLGLSTWIGLRDALLNGEAVVMQADRAMPKQGSTVVPFLHGHLRVPTGAVRLARLTGCPIVPVFTVRLAMGRFVIHLLPAIEPVGTASRVSATDPDVLAVIRAVESMVAAHPTQWLVLHAAFEEDAIHE